MLFPHLTSTACLGGEGVRQCTLVWGMNFLDKSKLMHFDEFYIMCGKVLVTSLIYCETYKTVNTRNIYGTLLCCKE